MSGMDKDKLHELLGGLIIRYPCFDDEHMTECVGEIETIPIPFTSEFTSEFTRSQGIKQFLKTFTDAKEPSIIRDIFLSVRKSKKHLSPQQVDDILDHVFEPLFELRKLLKVDLMVQRCKAKFMMMVPPCAADEKKLISTHDYLATNAMGRHHKISGIQGCLVIKNSNLQIYDQKFGMRGNLGSPQEDWKGLFVFDKEYLLKNSQYIDSPLKGKAVPVHMGSEPAQAAKARAESVVFDKKRTEISNQLCGKLTKDEKEKVQDILNDTMGSQGDRSIDELKKIYKILQERDVPKELYLTELGRLMIDPNELEVNFAGFNELPITHYLRKPHPYFRVSFDPIQFGEGRVAPRAFFLDFYLRAVNTITDGSVGRSAKRQRTGDDEAADDVPSLKELYSVYQENPTPDPDDIVDLIGHHILTNDGLLKMFSIDPDYSKQYFLKHRQVIYRKLIQHIESPDATASFDPPRWVGKYVQGGGLTSRSKRRVNKRNKSKKSSRKTLKKRPRKTSRKNLKKISKKSKRFTKRR